LGLLFTIPQSPRWLALKGRIAQAEASLRRLGSADPQLQLAEFQAGRANDGTQQRLSWSAHRGPILLAIGLACFNQLSGINAILYYLGDIFAAAGFSSVSADAQSVAVGATNLMATLLGMSLIDRLGRKKLLLLGAIGMAIALFGVALVMANDGARRIIDPADRLHCLLCRVARRGYLGLPERNLPNFSTRARTESRECGALAAECFDFRSLSGDCRPFQSRALRFFCGDDGVAAADRRVIFSGNAWSAIGTDRQSTAPHQTCQR
jgi:hypothetical protein